MGEPFNRPNEGFRFAFAGLKLNAKPDGIPSGSGKYVLAQNVRAILGDTLQTRAGQTLKFLTEGVPVTDIYDFSTPYTDSPPRYLLRNTADDIFLDNGTKVGSLTSTSYPGATMIPFRPNASILTYMYIANGGDYQKFSAPGISNNVVTQSKVGIAEPATAVDAVPDSFNFTDFSALAAGWTIAGTAGALSDIVRTTDTATAIFSDPSSAPPSTSQRFSVQVTSSAPGGGSGPTYPDWQANFNYFSGVNIMPTVGNPGNYIFTSQVPPQRPIPPPNWDPESGNVGPVWPQVYKGKVSDGSTGLLSWINTGQKTSGGGTGGAGVQYQTGETVKFARSGGGSYLCVVQDVPPPLSSSGLLIASIFYFSGNTGHAVVVPSNLPGTTTSQFISALRRGALVKLGTEICLVLSSSIGPNGTVCFELSTTGTHVAGEAITGVPSIVVAGIDSTVVGQALTSAAISSVVATGVGNISQVIAQNPFTSVMLPALSQPQQDDYLHFSINLSDLTVLTEIKLLIDIGDGSFTQNYFYYTIRPDDLALAISNTQTQLAAAQISFQQAQITQQLEDVQAEDFRDIQGRQHRVPRRRILHGIANAGSTTVLGVSQWTEIVIPITNLTRVGNDDTRTLAQANAVRISVNVTGSETVKFGSLWVGGGGQPDVGEAGAPYLYRVRPRSSVTGAVGNPSPIMRYGVMPRRQQVILLLPSPAYDAQIDTWDVFRYGGSLTSYRYVGSTPSTNVTFTDNYFDDAVGAGDELEYDNFEPWPSIDVPTTLAISQMCGFVLFVATASIPANASRWLPGTLIQVAGANVYTLQSRSTNVTGGITLLLMENAGSGTNVTATVQEPILARQLLPYMWGPDAAGTLFACGDPLRTGNLSFAKNFNPDSAPDSYNIEITVPSEPLMGGEVLDGLALVASTERWWALYPTPDNLAQRYSVVQQPITRGLAAPWGHCTDGKTIYFWAKDGIYAGDKSLTDDDLFNLFPHEGVLGSTVTYNGVSILAPNYQYVMKFRLSYANGYLYAIYTTDGTNYYCLVLDTHRGGWSVDIYSPQVSAIYHPQQRAAALFGTARYDEVLFGTVDGRVAAQTANANDLGGAIAGSCAVPEFDGGDIRAPKQWGDLFVDCTPVAAVAATPMSLGAGVVSPSTIAASAVRQRTPVSVGGVVVSDFLGLMLTWTDDFKLQSSPTQLHAWQPSFSVQPARTAGFMSFGADFELQGFGHLGPMSIAYVSTQPITLTITVFDGTSPAAITIPSSGGVYKKILFQPTANKGQLFKFQLSSSAVFQLFLDDCDFSVGAWGRQGPYAMHKDLGEKTRSYAAV